MARQRKQELEEQLGLALDPAVVGYGVDSDDGAGEEDSTDLTPQDTLVCALTGEFRPDEIDDHLTTRIAAAAAFLFSDEKFRLSPEGLAQLLTWQRWISTLFAASPFRNADAVLRAGRTMLLDWIKAGTLLATTPSKVICGKVC